MPTSQSCTALEARPSPPLRIPVISKWVALQSPGSGEPRPAVGAHAPACAPLSREAPAVAQQGTHLCQPWASACRGPPLGTEEGCCYTHHWSSPIAVQPFCNRPMSPTASSTARLGLGFSKREATTPQSGLATGRKRARRVEVQCLPCSRAAFSCVHKTRQRACAGNSGPSAHLFWDLSFFFIPQTFL